MEIIVISAVIFGGLFALDQHEDLGTMIHGKTHFETKEGAGPMASKPHVHNGKVYFSTDHKHVVADEADYAVHTIDYNDDRYGN